ncbi:carboxylesterase family protein [Corynebacterium auriscanis]|uniref:carboxylesterase family protein n=1 Tax=Corynebacterium auriscanis TaxID=99807 RepID=UPI003CE979F9
MTAPTSQAHPPLDIATEQGTVRGWRGEVADHWTAVPYANDLATTADLFSLPTAPSPYPDGLLIADRSRRGSRHTLSIASPAGASLSDAARPVVVFIHGGRYEMGEADSLWYRGSNFARDNCVYVAVNYRLRFEGFLPLADEPDVAQSQRRPIYRGVEDIFCALQWVQRNIASFGGDPSNVTLMGQSAGGALTHWVLSDPRSQGLVHRGVCLSMGLPRTGWPERVDMARKVLGGPLTMDYLGSLNRQQVKSAYEGFAAKYPSDCAVGPFPWDPTALRDLPMIMGSMRDEFVRTPIATKWDPYFTSKNPAKRLVARAVAVLVAKTMGLGIGVASKTNWRALTHDLRAYYRYESGEQPFRPIGHMVGDSTIRRFVSAALEARGDAPTWAYEFHSGSGVPSQHSPEQYCKDSDAQHCGDLPLVFDDLTTEPESVEGFCGKDAPARLQPLATRFHNIVVDFAHGKDPDWPRYQPHGERLTKLFDMSDCSESVASDPLREVRRLFPFAD